MQGVRALFHVDVQRFEALVRADRAATAAATPAFTLAPEHPAMKALAELAATTPPPPAKTRASLVARLARLEAKGASDDVTASLRVLDRIVSLTEEGIDAGLRIGQHLGLVERRQRGRRIHRRSGKQPQAAGKQGSTPHSQCGQCG